MSILYYMYYFFLTGYVKKHGNKEFRGCQTIRGQMRSRVADVIHLHHQKDDESARNPQILFCPRMTPDHYNKIRKRYRGRRRYTNQSRVQMRRESKRTRFETELHTLFCILQYYLNLLQQNVLM